MSSEPNNSDLLASFRDVGFSDEEAARLVALARPAVKYAASEAADDDIPIGASKYAGLPDLGVGSAWPVRDVYSNVEDKLAQLAEHRAMMERGLLQTLPDYLAESAKAENRAREEVLKKPFPLHFVAQFDFAEAAQANPNQETWVPRSGVLSIFYDLIEQPWGFDPADQNGFRVVFSTGELDRAPRPADLIAFDQAAIERHSRTRQAALDARSASKSGLLQRLLGQDKSTEVWVPYEHEGDLAVAFHRLLPTSHLTLPDIWQLQNIAPDLADQRASNDETDILFERWQEMGQLSRFDTQLGGWASAVQDPDMGLEAQLVSNGIYLGSPDGYNSSEANALKAGAEDWVLLAQITSDDGVWMWGDGGMLYVWIRKQDLAARDFDKAWVILQSY